MICSVCQFPWHEHFHYGWFQAINMKSLYLVLGRDVPNWLLPCPHRVLASILIVTWLKNEVHEIEYTFLYWRTFLFLGTGYVPCSFSIAVGVLFLFVEAFDIMVVCFLYDWNSKYFPWFIYILNLLSRFCHEEFFLLL